MNLSTPMASRHFPLESLRRKLAAFAILSISAMCASVPAHAASTLRLPQRACWSLGLEAMQQDGFESVMAVAAVMASQGSGGEYPGDHRRTVFIPSLSVTRAYHVHLPPNYTPAETWPIAIVLHGQPPSPAFSEAYALYTLAGWSALADARGFVVLAPIASGRVSGSWDPPDDDAMLDAVLADAEGAYNINTARRYLWGFSSGGHYGHGYALSHASTFAAYAVNAGALEGYAGPTAPVNASRKLPVSIRVGVSDSPGLLAAVRRDPPRFTANGWVTDDTLSYREFNGGHEYTAQEVEASWNFMCRFAVTP